MNLFKTYFYVLSSLSHVIQFSVIDKRVTLSILVQLLHKSHQTN
jgi:hypothetical protein